MTCNTHRVHCMSEAGNRLLRSPLRFSRLCFCALGPLWCPLSPKPCLLQSGCCLCVALLVLFQEDNRLGVDRHMDTLIFVLLPSGPVACFYIHNCILAVTRASVLFEYCIDIRSATQASSLKTATQASYLNTALTSDRQPKRRR